MSMNINKKIHLFISKNKLRRQKSSHSNNCPCNLPIVIVKAEITETGDASREGKQLLFCSRLMRGTKNLSRLLFPLIISASLKFEQSFFFNHQFRTIQQTLFRVQIPGRREKKSAALKLPHEAFHVFAAICACLSFCISGLVQ